MLSDLRKDIDQIDSDIVRLLQRRAKAAIDIGRYKSSNGLSVHDPTRETALLDSLIRGNIGLLPDAALRHIFTEIISACRELQRPTRVAYLGPEATFTHVASIKQFGRSTHLIPTNSIPEVFKHVSGGRADFGVVPVENSTEGSVHITLDELMQTDVPLSGEIIMNVTHCIMSKESNLDSIQHVLSHPQALAQCRTWLRQRLPAAILLPESSTAAAAQRAANEEGVAVVGHSMLAEMYGLELLEEGIQDLASNMTRFLILGGKACDKTDNDKTSVLFAVSHQPGGLYTALQPFAERGINLTKIESRPSKGTPWEYVFFVDLDGHISEEPMKEALNSLSRHVQSLKILGSYPKAVRDDLASHSLPYNEDNESEWHCSHRRQGPHGQAFCSSVPRSGVSGIDQR